MSWMSQLYRTYESHAGSNPEDGEIQITPVAHRYVNSQLEVTLNRNGEFVSARPVDRENAQTIIPVTEDSAGRSSGIAPHALSDTLPYIAGDFPAYGGRDKKAGEKFAVYIGNLKKWADSEHSHLSVRTICSYLERKCLMADLISAGVVGLNEEHKLDDKKISGQPYEKVMVRFRVFTPGNVRTAVWLDRSLMECYTAYYLTGQQGRKDFCYLTGRQLTISENHPKGIVAANYGAKLVSANDGQGYTFRGRFQDAAQSMALSYEASQKIHSALTWLAGTQGVSVGKKDKRTFICWNPEGKKLPDLLEEGDFDSIFEADGEGTEISYRKNLWRILYGYREQFEDADQAVVIGLDAATTGRLSVTYYNELLASDFLDRMEYWRESCAWYFLKFDEKRHPYRQIESPVFYRIAVCAYGREREETAGHYRITLDDRIMKEQVQRLIKSMLEKQPIPFELVQALMLRASNPLAYSEGNRERVLSTACAVIRKYYFDRDAKGEWISMKLNEENTERSYLFGRLLAVCEKVERATYEKEEKREPNAIRLQSAYVNHPLQTWKTLEQLLIPYFQKLAPGLRRYYKDIITGIIETFREEDEPVLNQGLKETYLLGYYLQRAELNKKKTEKTEEE